MSLSESTVQKLGLVVAGVALVAFVLTHGEAQARKPPCLSVPAVAMQATPETKVEYYEVKDGRIRHRDISIEDIVFRAAVFNTTAKRDVPWTHFSVLYTDTDGRGEIDESKDKKTGKEPTRTNDARVLAVLKFIDKSGSPPQEVVRLDSNEERAENEQRAKETQRMRVEIPKKKKLNFESNYYYVEVTLTRTSEDHHPDILGFQLCKQFK